MGELLLGAWGMMLRALLRGDMCDISFCKIWVVTFSTVLRLYVFCDIHSFDSAFLFRVKVQVGREMENGNMH